jgi:hypothetical protein
LAISENDGRSWTLIDLGGLPPETIFKLYPELKGRIDIPEKKPPVVIKEKEANQPPLQTPTSGTPAASAPAAPPSGAAGR